MNPGELDKVLKQFWKERKSDSKTRRFTEALVVGVREHLSEIDDKIKSYAHNWDIKRMGVVERNVMRMALYEMLYCSDVPPVVSINEAVDITKYFGNAESGKFVNGILDRARKDLSRPSRESTDKTHKP
jgi:N utilization substance protein B